MERGLFIAASGMLAAQIRQDVIANNLANATNAGFKGDIAVQHAFGDMLLQQVRTGGTVGPLSEGARITGVDVDARQGGMRNTGNPLDLAIAGDGWFSIQRPSGVAYTRDGAFTTDAQGRITTAAGEPVLGANGQPIVTKGTGDVGIDKLGRVLVGGAQVGQIAVTLLDPASLRKQGGDAVTGTPVTTGTRGAVAQGYLETANVNSVQQMVSLIDNMRSYEADQKVIHALDDTLGDATQQVGKV